MTDPVQTATERFAAGFNCSQALLSAFAAQAGIPEEAALKLASPFGGGIARQGQTCGAVSGALLALGLLYGSASPEKNNETYHIAQDFLARFRELHQTTQCRDLIGYDLSKPEELQNAREHNVFHTLCPAFVRDAAVLVNAMLEEREHRSA